MAVAETGPDRVGKGEETVCLPRRTGEVRNGRVEENGGRSGAAAARRLPRRRSACSERGGDSGGL